MRTPETIGRYEIIKEIGRGAMGLVYLAHDPRIDRHVAIKTIHLSAALPAAEADEMRARFTREAQAAGKLQHPGIVTIFDVGEHEGISFMAMEYIEGETLERYTRKENLLQVESVLHLIGQACDALEYAHQHHVVHRDIKPANLMLLKSRKLKITDFGLAKNPSTNLTSEGVLIGTPNYMSPEQVMGKPLDGRSDLFSLAAVLYEMLTGEKPFTGDSVTTIIYRILHEQPREPRLLNGSVPLTLSHVLMKALQKEPCDRFQSGGEFAQALHERATAGASQTLRVTASAPAQAERAAPEGSRATTEPSGAPSERRATAASAPMAHARTRVAPAPRTDPGRRPAARARSRGGLVRSIVILAATIALVLVAPRAITRDDRWGRGDAAGQPPFYRTAGIMAAGSGPPLPAASTSADAPKPPPVAVPSDAESVTVTLSTTPAGAKIYVDDVEALGGIVQLPKGDTSSHVVVAENDCFIEKTSYSLKRGETMSIPLKTPKSAKLAVTSKPSGARIILDGRDTGMVTPAQVPAALCVPHTVAFRLEGYKDVERKLADLGSSLDVTLARIPEGSVKFNAPYPLDVLEKGKKLGTAGEAIKLPSGSHTLMLRNEDLLVERSVTVKVEADRTIAPEAGLPGVGTLTVLASPSNCNIFINGRELGAPPINDHPVAAGTYTIRAVYVPTGEAKETTITITAGGGTRVPFKFSP